MIKLIGELQNCGSLTAIQLQICNILMAFPYYLHIRQDILDIKYILVQFTICLQIISSSHNEI
uniref:Uncharacterized protein n=1 Tax=Rhizophagus irregularis (strain DAOM 181602 / DAOM 197198 / MUCL 43194) TaxID=747089 RepID=U9TKU4_RHIID